MPTRASFVSKSNVPASSATSSLVGKRVRAWVEWRKGGFADYRPLRADELFRNGEYREGIVVSVSGTVAHVRVYKGKSSRIVSSVIGDLVHVTS